MAAAKSYKTIGKDEFMETAKKWADVKAADYIKKTFGECEYHIHTAQNMVEIYVENDAMDMLDEDTFVETMYVIEEILVENKLGTREELTGEELVFFSEDYWNSGNIQLLPLSELSEEIDRGYIIER